MVISSQLLVAVYPANIGFLVMHRFRHILAAGLIAIAVVSVVTPVLVCLIRGKSQVDGHFCCVPINKVKDSRPEPGNPCCVTAAHEDSSAPAGVFKCAPPTSPAVASTGSIVPFRSQLSSSAPVDDVSPPGLGSPSILRI